MEYEKSLKEAESRSQDLHRYFKNLKRRKPRNLDDVVHDLHEKVFAEIDCLKCANCCKTTSPIFRDVDIERISKKLKLSVSEFQSHYLKMDEDQDWVLQQSPCSFLMEDNSCFIYDVRPQACRDYPHTDRKRFVQVLDLTEKNALICPAVAEITAKMLDN